MRIAALLLLLAACGSSTLGGPCQQTCDCPMDAAASKCVGEWVCNMNQRCEYQCKGTCQTGGVSTCRSEETCNGTFCSERMTCH